MKDLSYDALSRLTSVSSPAGNASYQYDANGNLTTVNGMTTYHYNPFNRMDCQDPPDSSFA